MPPGLLGGSLSRALLAALLLFTQATRADKALDASTLVTHKYSHTTIVHRHDDDDPQFECPFEDNRCFKSVNVTATIPIPSAAVSTEGHDVDLPTTTIYGTGGPAPDHPAVVEFVTPSEVVVDTSTITEWFLAHVTTYWGDAGSPSSTPSPASMPLITAAPVPTEGHDSTLPTTTVHGFTATVYPPMVAEFLTPSEVVDGTSTIIEWAVYTRTTVWLHTDLATATLPAIPPVASQPIEPSDNPASAPAPTSTISSSPSSQATQESSISPPEDVSPTTETMSTSQAASVPDTYSDLRTSSTSQGVLTQTSASEVPIVPSSQVSPDPHSQTSDVSQVSDSTASQQSLPSSQVSATQTTGGLPLTGSSTVNNGSSTVEETFSQSTSTQQPTAAPFSTYQASQSPPVSTSQQSLPMSQESTEGLVATSSNPREDYSSSPIVSEQLGSMTTSSTSTVLASTGPLDPASTSTSEQDESQTPSSSSALSASATAPSTTSSAAESTESETPSSSTMPTFTGVPGSVTPSASEQVGSQTSSSSPIPSSDAAVRISTSISPGTTENPKSSTSALSTEEVESQKPSPSSESSTPTASPSLAPDPTDEADETDDQKSSPDPALSTSSTPTETAAEVTATGDGSEENTIIVEDDDDDDGGGVIVAPAPQPGAEKDKPKKDKPKKGKKKKGKKKGQTKGGWWPPVEGIDNPLPNPGLGDPHKPKGGKPDKKPDKKPSPGPGPGPDPEPSPEQSPTVPTETPTVTATDDAPECTESVAFEASCSQECTTFSFSQHNANFTSTWSECGDEECRTVTACETTPAVTVTSWSTSTCSKTITQTDVCEQLCTKIISKQTKTRGYTTETKCPSSVSCSPTVVCDPVEATTTTSYTTKIPKPTQACFLHRDDIASRAAKLGNSTDDDEALSNDTVATSARKRASDDGIHVIEWDRLTHPDTWSGGSKDWYRRWQTGLSQFGAGAAGMASAQFMEDDFAPSHAVYHPFTDMPFGTGVKNIDGCVAMLAISPHGVYVAHFYEVPTFQKPIPEYFSMPLMHDYEDTEATWRQRVTDFIVHGNLRFTLDGAGRMVPNPHDPASPSLADLSNDPSKPFHNMRDTEWSRLHFFAPISPENIAAGKTRTDYSPRLVRMRDLVRELVSFGGSREYPDNRMKNMLVVQYAPFNLVNFVEKTRPSPYRSVRVWFDGKVILERHWCIPNLAEILPIPPNLPDNTEAGSFPVAPPPQQSGAGLRLIARQEEGGADAPEVEAPTCPLTTSRVCAVEVGQTVIPTMNPSIQGTIDVTDDEGRRVHLEDFSGVPFGGFVTSEAADNRLGFNVTMQFEGSWDKFLIDEGYACNCTDSVCDLYSAQCCLKGGCPECDCPGGECKAGSPLCCADNSCNAARPREPTNYPFKAWDVKVFIKGEKGIGEEGDEDAWAKNVTCTSSRWDYLNETVVDGSCLAHRHLRCLWNCDR